MTAEQAHAELERVRAEKKPTRRGIMLCAQMMAEMLRLGWHKDTLDSFEILYWKTRDANGEMLEKCRWRLPMSTNGIEWSGTAARIAELEGRNIALMAEVATLTEAIREIKKTCLTTTHGPTGLAHIVRLCIDAGCTDHLESL